MRLPPLAALLLLLSACSDTDFCAQTPRCDEGQALNCETSCTVGPCSTGAHYLTCAQAETCAVVPGDLNSSRFYRSRAVCQLAEGPCDPATAGAPVCDGQGSVTGCGGHKRLLRVSCSQSGLYFEDAACCRGGTQPPPPDAGTPDAGSSDGGTSDGGTAGQDGGR